MGEDKRNVLLFSKKPFADIITRTVASFIDFTIICVCYIGATKYMMMDYMNDNMFKIIVPKECHYDFTVFLLFYTMASFTLRMITFGQGVGRKLAGANLVNCDGSFLNPLDVLMREVLYLCCSAAVLEPIRMCFNEEQGTSIDLITNMRDVDT